MRRITSVAAGVAHLVGPGSLKVVNGNLAYSQTGHSSVRLDPTTLTAVYCYGDVSISAPALELLFRHNVSMAWLSPAGTRCRGRLARTDASSTLCRIRQHRVFSQPAYRLLWAKLIVSGKIQAMTAAARHYQRHGQMAAGPFLAAAHDLLSRVAQASTAEQLLGLEGTASAAWFDFFATLFQPPWSFPGRTRRPPTDPLNALLSLGYTLLVNRAQARAEARGYEINLGGFHEYRPGRPSLACDLIEPLRVPAVDRWAVAVCARGEFTPDHFTQEENGGYRLLPKHFARTIHSWETHWVKGRHEIQLEKWLDRLGDFLKTHDGGEHQPSDEHTIP